jgi:GT2 family glycosyltransferase
MTRPSPERLVLSLVTGTVDRKDSFARLVDSVIRHTAVPWEMVVSDASSKPYGLELPGNVRVLEERPRTTCVKGYNRAFRAAAGQWVIWLNDDAEVCSGYDEAAIAFMEAHPEIGLGALHYSECGGPFHVNSAWGTIYANFGIISKELGDQVGWFDDRLQMYGCDNSLSLRVLLADRGVADIEGARILHHSVKDQTRADNQRHRMRDTEVLQETYLPFKRQWMLAFNRHRVIK